MLYSFENFIFDTERRELRCNREPVALQPQVFDLLEHLIRHRDRVVSKDELINEIWSGRIVSESALTTRINAARTAVGDSGEAQRLIRTLPRKGVRFVGSVQERALSVDAQSRGEAGTTATATIEIADKPLALPDKPSIAVMPFQNMSSDPEQDYFADGITEDIITALSRFKSMFVIARNSSFTYKGKAVDIRQVGRELGVRYVLEGSVRKAGGRVRISGQLIEAATAAHLWANTFDGAAQDLFDLQDSVTRSVVGAIAPRLIQAEIDTASRKPTRSLDSYDRYLRGMALVHQASSANIRDAMEEFRQALALDSNLALALAMVATCSVGQAVYHGHVATEAERSNALVSAARAVELAPDDDRVLAACALAFIFLNDQLERARVLAERAIDLNPNLSAAWVGFGWANTWLGELDRARAAFDQAIRLNPLDKPRLLTILPGYVVICWLTGQYEERVVWLNRLLALDPTNLTGLLDLWDAAESRGRTDEATEIFARLREAFPELRASHVRQSFGRYRKPEHRAFFDDFMRRLPLPE